MPAFDEYFPSVDEYCLRTANENCLIVDEYRLILTSTALLLTNTTFGPRSQSSAFTSSSLPSPHLTFPDVARWRRQRYKCNRGRGPHRYTRWNGCGVPAVLRRVPVRRYL